MCIRPFFATYMSADASELEPPAKRHASQGAATSHVKETRPQETLSNGSAPAVVLKAQRTPSLEQGTRTAPPAPLGRGKTIAPAASLG